MGGVADDAAAYVAYLLAICLIIAMFQSCGLLLSVLFPKKVLVVAMLCMSFCFLFAGVFQPLSQTSVPDLAYINPVYYAECLLARTVFLEGRDYTPRGYNATTGTPPKISREQALGRYSLVTPAWACVCVLLGIQLAARVGAFVVLQRKYRKVLLTQQDAEAGPSGGDRLIGLSCFRRGRRPAPVEDARAASATAAVTLESVA